MCPISYINSIDKTLNKVLKIHRKSDKMANRTDNETESIKPITFAAK